MHINIEFGELLAFIAVAEKSSFKAAAEGLFISQPALSRRVEKLEEGLQVRLFERTTRRVRLTDAGKQFLVHAQAVMAELALAVQGAEQRGVRRNEHITIASVPSVANHLLPLVIKDFARLRPNVRIKIIDESAQLVLSAVKHGEADFGLNFIGAQDAEIEFKPIHVERYLVCVPLLHPLASLQSIGWELLENEKMVSVSPSSGNRYLIDNAFAKTARRPVIQYEVNHVAGALSLVAAGVGIAILPELALTNAVNLVGIPLTEPKTTRTLGLITRKGAKLHPIAVEFVDAFQSVMRDWIQ